MSRVTGGVGNETMCAIYRIGMEVLVALAIASAMVRCLSVSGSLQRTLSLVDLHLHAAIASPMVF